MRAGLLRHRIEIQTRAPDVDALGQPIDDWQTAATVWASVEDLRGREFFEARQANVSEVTARVVIRHRPDVAPAQRLVHGARRFNVIGILDPDGRRRRLELMCEEILAGEEA